MLGPLLDKLASEKSGAFVLAKVNIDESQDLAARYGIEAIPAVKAFRDGKPVLEFVGLLPEAQIRDFVERIVPSQADQLARQAASLETSQPAEAEALYRQALAQESGHEKALVGLARLLIGRGQDEEAGTLLERSGPGGEEGAEVQRLTGILALRRLSRVLDPEPAIRQRLLQDPENARSLYELGLVLAAVGKYKEALDSLLKSAERDRKLATGPVREAMVEVFHIIGVRSDLADEYRDKLSRTLY
jgi:putative thioredoxin